MATSTIPSQNGNPIDQTRNYSNKFSKLAPDNPKRYSWRENAANPRASGIEFREQDSDKLVHFITIHHPEVNKDLAPFRICVPVEEDGTFTMPKKETFEEMIQYKRRQQGQPASTSSVLSSRAARRVSNAARRRSSGLSLSTVNQTPTQNFNPDEPANSSRRRPSKKSKPSKKKKPSRPSTSSTKPKTSKKSSATVVQQSSPKKVEHEPAISNLKPSTSTSTAAPTSISVPTTSSGLSVTNVNEPNIVTPTVATPIATTSTTESLSSNITISKPFEVKTLQDDIASVTKDKSIHMISSMKELARQNPLLGSIDKKEIKRLLKSAPPGAAIVLSNGTVIKKSRRGGARVGAGRKRSRPLLNGSQQSSSNLSSSLHPDSSSFTNISTSSEQTVCTNSANTSEANVAPSNP